MRAGNISIQFERQDHQDKCVENIMNALEMRQDSYSLRLADDYLPIRKFPRKPDENRLDVLMETGTGKTYVYIKTIFEMHKRFNKTKFIIIVPRMSIRHGVIQNIRQTADHFFSQYNKRLRCVSYPDESLNSVVNNFIRTNDLSVLLITNHAFNSQDNRINRHSETLYGTTTVWKTITGISPVVIMDEPHLLAGSRTVAYLEELRANSLVIRFGATYPDSEKDGLSNVVYALDSISAFNNKLVKRINVSVVSSSSEDSDVHVTNTHGKTMFTMAYTINGQQRKADVHLGDDLGAVTDLISYRGKRVTNITSKKIVLDDGKRFHVGEYNLADYEIRHMVRYTISQHFEREQALFHKGIKTLSLFFIPGINDFRGHGRIKKIFEDEYVKARKKKIREDSISDAYRAYLDRDYYDDKLRVHDGYFSSDKERLSEQEEAKAVNMILKDKERLLSLDEPLRFIFSVWALREGWDNPNVFNICKLSHSTKDNSRRQQVGRGLRIAVDQHGLRMTEDRLAKQKIGFYDVNELNMVVPAYEYTFIEDIQREIHDASPSVAESTLTLDAMKRAGLSDVESSMLFMELLRNHIIDMDGNRLSSVYDFLISNKDALPGIEKERFAYITNVLKDTSETIVDGNKSRIIRVRPDKWKKFKDLWEHINRDVRMVYKNIDEECIIRDVCELFNNADIPTARTKVARWMYDSGNDEIRKVMETETGDSDYFQRMEFGESVMRVARNHKLPIGFLLKLFNRIDLVKFMSNPEEAERQLMNIIRDTVHHTILERVEYQFAETTVYGNGLQNEDGSLKQSLPASKLGKNYSAESPPDPFLYDTAAYDSSIEQRSIRDDPPKYEMDNHVYRIVAFAKLPRIDIPTPYKTYNPDFAYVISRGDGKSLFLVVETKGHDSEADVPQDEQRKIEYGDKFFESLRKTLPGNVEICFKKRLNMEDMSDILRECYSE